MSGPAVVITQSRGVPVTAVASGAPLVTAKGSGGPAVVLADDGAPFVIQNLILNERFDAAGSWTLPTGLAISGGTLNKTEAPGVLRTATLALGLVNGASYRVTWELADRSASSVAIQIGGTLGTARSADGVYSSVIIAGATGLLGIRFNSATNTGIKVRWIRIERV